jgi:hypothetical protein
METRTGLQSAIEAFRRGNAAPAAFESFQDECMRLARVDPLNAGFYVMLGLAARSFTEAHEGEPLTANVASEAKAQLLRQAERVVPALGVGPEARLALLNDLAHALAAGR